MSRVLYEERVKKIIETKDVGYFAQMYAKDVPDLLAQADDRENHITDVVNRCSRLLQDQRDLKGLIRKALSEVEGGYHLSGNWVLEAQAMLERMK